MATKMTREEAINTVRNIYQTDKEKEALATLIPELAESEEERIRRWLCDYFSSIDKAWIHKDITCIDILRWLEKQKEQKKEKFPPYVTGFKGHPDPTGTSDLEEAAKEYASKTLCDPDDGPSTGLAKESFIAGAEWQKEQKHPNGCFTCDEYKKGYEEGRRNGFTAGYNKAMKEVEQKEQKPVQSEEEKEYVRTLKGLVSDFIRDSGGGITDIEYYQNICDWLDGRHIEQKPNIEICPHSIKSKSYKENGYPIEDCDYGLEIAQDILEKTLGKVEGYQSDDGIREHLTAIQAVKDAMKEQKPAEWSQEDEKDMAHIIRILDDCYVYGTHDLSKTDYENLVNKLKSLRPSWKPSEEQMKALYDACCIAFEEERDFHPSLSRLYHDLRKL